MGILIDLSGKKYDSLTVIKMHHVRKQRNGRNVYYWLCKCNCGNEVIKTTNYLRYSNICSCGCLSNRIKDPINNLKKPFDEEVVYSKTRIYRIWQAMKSRCYNPNHKHYYDYGGRGIEVCPEWLNSSLSFINWSYDTGYNDNLSIDRIDTNGNYCPENCRWVDCKTQSNNKRTSHFITFNGKTQTIGQWSDELGINYNTLENRLKNKKWSVEKALTTKPRRS